MSNYRERLDRVLSYKSTEPSFALDEFEVLCTELCDSHEELENKYYNLVTQIKSVGKVTEDYYFEKR